MEVEAEEEKKVKHRDTESTEKSGRKGRIGITQEHLISVAYENVNRVEMGRSLLRHYRFIN
jgi:hypothetical protein